MELRDILERVYEILRDCNECTRNECEYCLNMDYRIELEDLLKDLLEDFSSSKTQNRKEVKMTVKTTKTTKTTTLNLKVPLMALLKNISLTNAKCN